MSQAKTVWQQIFDLYILLINNRQLRRLIGQGFFLVIFALLWLANWKLFLATSVGIGAMSCCYLLQNPHWQRYYRKWTNFLVDSNRQLAFAVGAGATGAFSTYLAASVWADAENQWLATGSILQGLVSFATLALVLWSLKGKKASSLEAKLEQILSDLSHRDRLKKLVAIRKLTRLLVNNRLSPEHYGQSIEYFQLMLSEPQAPAIKNALLESLNILDLTPDKNKAEKVRIPLQLHSHKSILDKAL